MFMPVRAAVALNSLLMELEKIVDRKKPGKVQKQMMLSEKAQPRNSLNPTALSLPLMHVYWFNSRWSLGRVMPSVMRRFWPLPICTLDPF